MKCELDGDTGVFATIPLNGSTGLMLRAGHIRAERTGIHAEVAVSYGGARLAYDTFNISRNEERSRLSKAAHGGLSVKLRELYPREAMKNDLDTFCGQVWDTWLERDPVIEIVTNVDDVLVPPKWLIEPLIMGNQPNILYGERSGTKSLTALILTAIGSTQWTNNPLLVKPPANWFETLYLDFERNDELARYNMARLQRGMNLSALVLTYKRLYGSLSHNIEWVHRYLRDHPTIHLTVVDSLTAAAGGNLNESAPAQEMFEAERSLNTTTLFLAHASNKDPERKTTTVIGHSSYETYAGNIWECRKHQEEQSSTADTCLYHRKAPAVYGLRKPIGFRTVFDEDHHTLHVSHLNPQSVDEFIERMSLNTRILNALLHHPSTSKELSETLNEKAHNISQAIARLRANGAVVEVAVEGKASRWGRCQAR